MSKHPQSERRSVKYYLIRTKNRNGQWVYFSHNGPDAFCKDQNHALKFHRQESAMKAAVWAMLHWPNLTEWEMETIET